MTRATIIVSGMVASDPFQGGATWAVLQYVLGLARLGHDVWLVEPIACERLRNALGEPWSGAPHRGALAASVNADYFRQVVARFGLVDRSALLLEQTGETFGVSYEQLRACAQRADLLINIAGMLTDPALLAEIPRRVYLDLDPAFSQLWHAVEGVDMRFAGHTHFLTIGQHLGTSGCVVPTCGLPWRKTLQPVVLELWPEAEPVPSQALTTIAHWRAYGSIQYRGVQYGQKAHSLRPLFELPSRTTEKFRLALGIHPNESNDLAALRANGWVLEDPLRAAGTPDKYQRFIQGSKAEFGLAKSGYVGSQCGWFSDRSACYLASGRPVIAQDTGFGQFLPTGEGLFSFRGGDDVLAALEQINRDYPRQARRARAIATEFFSSARVLKLFLEGVGLG